MRGIKRILPVVLSAALMFGACAPSEPLYEYEAAHVSYDNLLHFYSSDNTLDAFLNEFFVRHMRYNEFRIHSFPVGAGQPVWKEWEAMIGSFWDASPENLTDHYATNRWVEDWLRLDYMSVQDRQGYISTSAGVTASDWGQGWAFPNYTHNNKNSFGEEFSKGVNGWTGESGTVLSTYDAPSTVTFDGSGIEHYLRAETSSAADEIVLLSPLIRDGKGTNAFYNPFLHFSWKLELTEGDASALDDLYVYFQTERDGENWPADQCVRYSEYASVAPSFEEAEGTWQGTFLNMFLNEKWGRNVSVPNMITRLKFVLKAKEGSTFRGKLDFNFIRGDFDDRFSDNCGQYISAAKHYLSYTQDRELLAEVLPVARGAMQFYLTCLDGASGLIDNRYLVGHFNSGTAATGVGIGDGFWDAISFPNVNLYANLSFHQALVGMLYLEEMAEACGVEVPAVTVLGKDMKTVVRYEETAESLREKIALCEERMRSVFWDEEKGRFFAGYYDTADGEGVTDRKMDYGFLMFNLQTVTDGIASAEQAEKIMEWVSGAREIEGDDSAGADIYKYEFAPRFTTKHNATDGIWAVGQASHWEVGVRDGGAVMQTSYYDLTARSRVLGADNAFERLKGIEAFYLKVREAGGTGTEFYRAYFNQLGIGMQGNYDKDGDGVADGDNEGPIGIDCEFLEAALLLTSVPDAFFGLDPRPDGTLTVEPNFPAALDYWRMENLMFGGVLYDLSVGKYFVQLSNIKETSDKSVKVLLARPDFAFTVEYLGKTVDYTEENGRIAVTIPFADGKVEIRKK